MSKEILSINFHYLDDQNSSSGGCSVYIVARIRAGWAKFRELLPLMATKRPLIKVKDRLYMMSVYRQLYYIAAKHRL